MSLSWFCLSWKQRHWPLPFFVPDRLSKDICTVNSLGTDSVSLGRGQLFVLPIRKDAGFLRWGSQAGVHIHLWAAPAGAVRGCPVPVGLGRPERTCTRCCSAANGEGLCLRPSSLCLLPAAMGWCRQTWKKDENLRYFEVTNTDF